MKRALLLSAFLALLLAPSASAGWRIDRATAIAAVVWHSPCAGSVPLHWANITWAYAAQSEGCALGVTIQSARPASWSSFCSTMIHEYGHLAGVEHTDYGIMQPGDAYVDPRCAKRGRPYLERHGLLKPR